MKQLTKLNLDTIAVIDYNTRIQSTERKIMTKQATVKPVNEFAHIQSATEGYWEYSNGEEGGELHFDPVTKEVTDFDGDFDLPSYVKKELRDSGYTVDF